MISCFFFKSQLITLNPVYILQKTWIYLGLFFTLPSKSVYTSILSLQRQRTCEEVWEKEKPHIFPRVFPNSSWMSFSWSINGSTVAPVWSRIQLNSQGKQPSNVSTGLNKLLEQDVLDSCVHFQKPKQLQHFQELLEILGKFTSVFTAFYIYKVCFGLGPEILMSWWEAALNFGWHQQKIGRNLVNWPCFCHFYSLIAVASELSIHITIYT